MSGGNCHYSTRTHTVKPHSKELFLLFAFLACITVSVTKIIALLITIREYLMSNIKNIVSLTTLNGVQYSKDTVTKSRYNLPLDEKDKKHPFPYMNSSELKWYKSNSFNVV
jgi:hypothetical protein